MSEADVIAIAESLAERGFLQPTGFWPDGSPKFEVTQQGWAALKPASRVAG